MGFRFRQSFKIAPGIKLNVGKKSLSIRAGVRGFGLTSGTSGTRATAGIPGTGISYSKKLGQLDARQEIAEMTRIEAAPVQRSLFVRAVVGLFQTACGLILIGFLIRLFHG